LPFFGCCAREGRSEQGERRGGKQRERQADLSPQLADVFKHHVAMAIERLHLAEELSLVAAVDQNLLRRLTQER
jgi:hypothetical protein